MTIREGEERGGRGGKSGQCSLVSTLQQLEGGMVCQLERLCMS
jgi:hypothetical protein